MQPSAAYYFFLKYDIFPNSSQGWVDLRTDQQMAVTKEEET